jgi:hypothetical protein
VTYLNPRERNPKSQTIETRCRNKNWLLNSTTRPDSLLLGTPVTKTSKMPITQY